MNINSWDLPAEESQGQVQLEVPATISTIG